MYYSILISTKCDDVLYGYEYLPGNVNIKKYLSFICKKYRCDIIVINDIDKSPLKSIKKFNFDINIKVFENKLILEEYKNKTFITNNLIDIYHQIISDK